MTMKRTEGEKRKGLKITIARGGDASPFANGATDRRERRERDRAAGSA